MLTSDRPPARRPIYPQCMPEINAIPDEIKNTVIDVERLGCNTIIPQTNTVYATIGARPVILFALFLLAEKYAEAKMMIVGFASSPGIIVIPIFTHLRALFTVTPRGVKIINSIITSITAIRTANRLYLW